MFLKDKVDGKGEFTSLKSRMVASKTRKIFEDLSSPTANPITVMTLLHINAVRDYELSTYDWTGAFLTTPIDHDKDKRLFLRVPKIIVGHWKRIYPEATQFIHSDGCLYLELEKYLYGLPPASNRFHEFVKKILLKNNFVVNAADPCAFHLETKWGPIDTTVHVDDFLASFPNLSARAMFEDMMKPHGSLTAHHNEITYLGMTIERDRARRITKISQDGYVKSLLEKFGGAALKPAETPGSEDMFEIDPESPDLDEREKKFFISLIMSLMYLARFTFGQILVYVNFLSTRLSKPKVQDMKKAKRILRYLAGAKDHGLYLGGDKIDCRIWVDTSHGVHADGKGQGCIIISLGLGPVFVRSYKLRVTGLSSTEDEVVGVSDTATYAPWMRALLEGFRQPQIKPTVIYQDNQSAMAMLQPEQAYLYSWMLHQRTSGQRDHHPRLLPHGRHASRHRHEAATPRNLRTTLPSAVRQVCEPMASLGMS